MSFKAAAIANEFIELAIGASDPVSPMKLQKLVYYAHGWHLALMDGPLVNESVEAWKWGPVIPSLWGDLRMYGPSRITEKLRQLQLIDGEGEYDFVPYAIPDSEYVARRLVGRIWGLYGKLSATELSNMTHEPGTPWYQVWMPMKDNPIRRKDIPNELIRDYFRAKLNVR